MTSAATETLVLSLLLPWSPTHINCIEDVVKDRISAVQTLSEAQSCVPELSLDQNGTVPVVSG